MDVFSELFSDPTTLFFAVAVSFFAWQSRHQSKVSETLFGEFHEQYKQFKDELPKLRGVLERLESGLNSMQTHLTEMDKEHHEIIITRDSKIVKLEEQIEYLSKLLEQTQKEVIEANARLQSCETTRRLITRFLDKIDPEVARELRSILDTN